MEPHEVTVDGVDPFDTEVAGPPAVDVASSYPAGAQRILEVLAPYLASVTEAVLPLLAAQGLSTEASVDELLAIDGLVESVVGAAKDAVTRVNAIGLEPAAGFSDAEIATDLPLGWGPSAPPARVPALDVMDLPAARQPSGLPDGWSLHIESPPRYLASDLEGNPCYPDIPAFEDYWPKCPLPEPPTADVPDGPCLEDERYLRALERLEALDHFYRVPTSFRGYNYHDKLADSVRDNQDLYRCGSDPDPTLMAAWYGPSHEGIVIYDRFLDLSFRWDLISLIAGPVNFRAAILLHEHVHRLEDPQVGTVSAPADRDHHPVGSQGQDDCPGSGTEYDGAYIQTLYLGAGEIIAQMVGNIYARKQCGQIGRSAQLFAAAGDIIAALALGWIAAIEVIATLAAGLALDIAGVLWTLFEPNISGVLAIPLA